MSTFKSWTREKLKKRFGLKRVYDHPNLVEWLNSEVEINRFEAESLEFWREGMLKYIDYWNEEEVKLKFIGNIVTLVRYDTDEISCFAERYIGGVVDGEELNGFPDLIIATGKQEIDAPFFFLHEYKKELDNDSPDPAAQCLSAMLLAYELNLNVPKMAQKPVFGAYIIGRSWFFMVLNPDKTYCISDVFSATHTDDLLKIYKMMKVNCIKIKEIWEE
ncbi:MAG: hypothetical protein EAZ85_02800 [Bacteroidetes bacterium]|nr:MAG: hypothetical protein EAZ85_02800 [Bacteroidota bacterium]